MRATILALLLSLPLLAGDRSPLAEAVELFESPDAARREAGSALARNQLQKLLGPLLAALQHADPEVRRRARRAILSLVPGEIEKETQPELDPRVLRQVVQLRMRQQVLQRLARNREAVAKLRAQNHKTRENLGAAALAAFGVTGHSRRQAPLQPGLSVRWVRRGSAAQRLGLRPGDLIVKVNGRATSRLRDFAAVKDWRRVEILVQRDRKYVYLPPRAAPK